MTIDVTNDKLPTREDEDVSLLKTSLDVQFPVVRQSGYSLMVDIFGEEKGKFIVSPEGGIPKKDYLRLASELRPDEKSNGWSRGDGENKAVGTEKDTLRFWMLRNPEFQDALVEHGWTVFPKMSEWSDYEKKEHLLTKDDSYTCVFRQTTLSDLTKVLRASTSQQHVEKLLERLDVVGKFLKDDKIYTGYSKFISPPVDPMVVGETIFPGIHFKLGEFFSPLAGIDYTPIIDLNGVVHLGGREHATGLPDRWSERTTDRVKSLVRDKMGKNQRGYCQNIGEESFIINYNDRGETVKDSAELEGRLNQMREWVKYGQRAAALEKDEIEKARTATYEDRKTRLGTPPEKTE